MSTRSLKLRDAFEWNDQTENSTNEKAIEVLASSEDEGVSEKRVKVKKFKREKSVGNEEIKRHSSKIGIFDPSTSDFHDLETLDECEYLVTSFPDSSKAWLLYMVFHLKQAEVERARNIAQKALNTISFRQEKEKLNIWIALINLENLYGTQESLMDVFKKALLCNDPKIIYNHLVDLYVKDQKLEEAEQLLDIMVQKFKQDEDVWIKYIILCMKSGRSGLAHKLMDRSLKSLEKKFHANVMAKVAQLECESGSFEKGLSKFETIIQNYPKRKDILSIYISILSKAGEHERAKLLSATLRET